MYDSFKKLSEFKCVEKVWKWAYKMYWQASGYGMLVHL